MTTSAQRTLWVGTYPAEGSPAGSGEGVWQVTVDADGRFGEPCQMLATPSPSFVALHPSGRTLYAVAETDPGTVTAFPLSDDGEPADPVTIGSGGASPCHLHATADVLWIANYADGVASVIPLDPETGAFAADAVTAFKGQGAGPRGDRQEGPHAHFTGVVGEHALVVDLGADQIRRYPSSVILRPEARRISQPGHTSGETGVAAVLPPGTGPRHFAELPGGALAVAGELDGQVHVLAPSGPGTWEPASATPATLNPAELAQLSHVTVTGDLLLVGVRGADVLSVHRVADADDAAPSLKPLADIDLGAGAWPRHHAVVGDAQDGRLLAVVARQGMRDLGSVLIDTTTGEGAVVGSVSFPTPATCVLEAP